MNHRHGCQSADDYGQDNHRLSRCFRSRKLTPRHIRQQILEVLTSTMFDFPPLL